ncbi:MAG: hypothetical protein ACXAB2_06710, partial [Candidatus Hodarchaeales archaeon]
MMISYSKETFNDFRANYHNMSFEDKRDFYRNYKGQLSSTKWFDLESLKHLFPSYKKNLRVLELGGSNGELAKEFLSLYPNIISWENVDLVQFGEFSHPKYHETELNDYLWNFDQKILRSYNFFIASNVLEHFNEAEIIQLFIAIKKQAKRVLIEVPLKTLHKTDWRDYLGSHVL